MKSEKPDDAHRQAINTVRLNHTRQNAEIQKTKGLTEIEHGAERDDEDENSLW